MEISFVVLLVIVAQLCHHLFNLRAELNTAEKENAFSVTPHWLNLISVFFCIVVKSAQPLTESVLFLYLFSFFLSGHKWNSKYSRGPGGHQGPPEMEARRLRATAAKELWVTGSS